MANDLGIYVGSGEVTIWDATNGYKYLGYVENVEIIGKPAFHKILDGNYRQIYNIYNFDCSIFDASQDMVDELETRKDTKQKVYVVGNGGVSVLENVYLVYGEERPFSNEDPQLLNVSARTFQGDDHTHYTNLLGVTGSFEIGSTNCAGWVGGRSPTREVTFMTASGGTYCQGFTSGDMGAGSSPISCSLILPTYTSKKVYASIWGMVSGSTTTTSDLTLKLEALNESDGVLSTKTTSWPSLTGTAYGRVNALITTPHNTLIKTYRLTVEWIAAESEKVIVIDNAQLEFGAVSDFKDY